MNKKSRIKRIIKFLGHPIKKLIFDKPFPSIVKYVPNGKYIASHISAFGRGNSGNTLLPVVLRDLFNSVIGVKVWHGYHVREAVDEKSVRRYNEDDFILIGGGGLFISDTYANDVSGWQWNCSIQNLLKIEKPIVCFAVGYNRFRGQKEFKPIFTEHLNRFVEKAVFVGIRNHGSIEALKNYLKEDELKKKLFFQPCMTTLISKIYPSYHDFTQKDEFIALNCAFDRQMLRANSDEYLKSIARVVKELSKRAKIKYFCHMSHDKNALPYLEAQGVEYELVELKDVKQIIECYSKARLVIGMRGHAQMIPFGCCTPILSIVSHDKMQWFLDDIHHPEWGVDVNDIDFESKLLEKANKQYDNYKKCIEQIEREKEKMWEITMDNMLFIKKSIQK